MTQDQLFSQITALVNEINTDAAALFAKRERLRALTRQWAGNDKSADKPKKAARRRGTTEQVNISAAVLALVNRQTGLNVPQIMDKLGFRDHEAAVRSALKKAKDSTITSVDGRWYPIAPNPPAAQQKERAPSVTSEPVPAHSDTAVWEGLPHANGRF